MIVPAHNEAAVIARCLQTLRTGTSSADMEVIVVCNGCTDRTAEFAQDADPSCRIVSIAEASKCKALNAGDSAASRFPRIYLDADIGLDGETALATARLLGSDDVLCAAPRPHFHLADRPFLVRWFYEVWSQIPYFDDGMVGSGVYALSEGGRARFDDFPAVTADDQFVMQLFTPTERRSLDRTFTVHTPRTVSGLLRMRTRVYRGNAELISAGLSGQGKPPPAGPALLHLARRPSQFLKVATYVAINLVAKRRARRTSNGWERDDSARMP